MFINVLLDYINGYVNISVEGYYIERFINICKSKGVFFWNMKREKSSILYANVGIKEFKKIREIARKLQCRIKIKRKKGLPFIFNKYKKRKIFFILLIMVICALISCSNYIWNVEINGISKISKQELVEQLEECGLKIGSVKKNVDTKQIISNIRLIRNDIAWIGITISGTNAKIEVVEATEKPEIIDDTVLCNIVADKDCIITKINVQNGTAMVKKGDLVKKGALLVEGKIQGKYTDAIYVNSLAEIQGRVWYSKKSEEKFEQIVEEQTGNEEIKYAIKFNKFKINFYKTLSKFENYDTICEENKINIFSNFYLPIEIIKLTNYEKINKSLKYEEKELKNKLISELEEQIKNDIGEDKNIIDKYVNYKKSETGIEVELVYEVLEDIGTKEKINN